MLPWRNWLARSAVNRKVGGSSPPGSVAMALICHARPVAWRLADVETSWSSTTNLNWSMSASNPQWEVSYRNSPVWNSDSALTYRTTLSNKTTGHPVPSLQFTLHFSSKYVFYFSFFFLPFFKRWKAQWTLHSQQWYPNVTWAIVFIFKTKQRLALPTKGWLTKQCGEVSDIVRRRDEDKVEPDANSHM